MSGLNDWTARRLAHIYLGPEGLSSW